MTIDALTARVAALNAEVRELRAENDALRHRHKMPPRWEGPGSMPCPFVAIGEKACKGHQYDGCRW